MTSSPRLYLDSCCFIDLVKEQEGLALENSEREQDVWFLKRLMIAHRNKDVALYTSFLAVAECVSIEKGATQVPLKIQDRFRQLLTSGQYVTLLAQTPKTAQMAQDLRWKHGIVLKGPDCLHISAALEAGCVEFLTTDGQLLQPKLAAAMPKLQTIGLMAVSGRKTTNLPTAYRQEEMAYGSQAIKA